MKTIVVNQRDSTRVPFLRGILIRSLLDAGLMFEDAFRLATKIRDLLSDTAEIRTEELTAMVIERLHKGGFEEEQESYRNPAFGPTPILVEGPDGVASAFSRGRHERLLQASGLNPGKAERITALIYEQMLAAGVTRITTGQLGYLSYCCLREEVGKKLAGRFLLWSEFQASGRPLVLSICGAVGTGKSTIATEAAHLLDIVRIQSTDMLREVMRMMMPTRLLPVLHSSSFSAWRELPIRDMKDRSHEQLVADGYRSQLELIAVACEAVIQRAVAESVPIILEGVHAHPDLLQYAPDDSAAIMAHVTLAVLRPKELKSRLRGRSMVVPSRHAERYIKEFDSIWSLQSFLLSEADRCNAPIITNQVKDKTVQQVILHVNDELSRHFSGTPDEVFGESAHGMTGRGDRASWRDLLTMFAGQ